MCATFASIVVVASHPNLAIRPFFNLYFHFHPLGKINWKFPFRQYYRRQCSVRSSLQTRVLTFIFIVYFRCRRRAHLMCVSVCGAGVWGKPFFSHCVLHRVCILCIYIFFWPSVGHYMHKCVCVKALHTCVQRAACECSALLIQNDCWWTLCVFSHAVSSSSPFAYICIYIWM